MRSGVVLLALAFVACSVPVGSNGSAGTNPTSRPIQSPDLTPFVGEWSDHGGGLTISPDGSFTFEWRTYRFCTQAPPPCDQSVNNLITGGGRAIGTVHAVGGRSAAGQVTATNDPSVVPAGSFVADVTEYELLTLRFPAITFTLCGKNFATMAPTQVAQAHPCGG